jgi:acetyl-CoA C-acetyltransferase
MQKSFIISAKRSPFGSLYGYLSGLSAVNLATEVAKSVISPLIEYKEDFKEVILGEVLTCGLGQNPARQVAIYSGLNEATECITVNKVCGSGLKAICLADDRIKLNYSDLILAGGVESMSNSPYYLAKSKIIPKLAEVKIHDSVINDGLTDPFSNMNMSQIAELTSSKYGLTRKMLDDFACQSYIRMQNANNTGKFEQELVPIHTFKKLRELVVTKDEEPFRFPAEKVYSFKPIYGDDGVITPGNSSKINDGAALVVVASENFIEKNNIKPLVEIVAHASVGVNPIDFLLAPSKVIPKVLEKANLTIEDIDLFEINEAFATVVLLTQNLLNINPEKINVNGGAIALGHPIGASGARLVVSSIYEMKRKNAKYALCAACIGSGEAIAMIIKNVE